MLNVSSVTVFNDSDGTRYSIDVDDSAPTHPNTAVTLNPELIRALARFIGRSS